MTNYLDVILGCLICLIGVFLYFQNKFKHRLNSDEYLTLIKHLELIVNLYKSTVLKPQLSKLDSEFDLNPESQFNSIKTYKTVVHDLYKTSTKEIIKSYLPPSIQKLTTKYFTINTLGIFIMNVLKDES